MSSVGTLPPYDEALHKVLAEVQSLSTEAVPFGDAAGRVLREPITADRDQPPFNRSAMDGFATRHADIHVGKPLPIVGELPAGGQLAPSCDTAAGVIRIATGAVVPDAYDTVVPIERADVVGDSVSFKVDPALGSNIHARGADAKAGDVVLAAGCVLQPRHIGIVATVGAAELTVTRRPRVVVMSTGDELKPASTPTNTLACHQIRDSNGPMIATLINNWGGELVEHIHVADEREQTLAGAREALSKANLVITAGGVSAGQRDLLPETWKQLGLTQVLHGVAIQPGKPLLVCQPEDESEKLVMGLPGNPVSVLATAHLFVWPVLRKMMGLNPALPWRRVWLSGEAKTNTHRELFRIVHFVGQTREQVEVIDWQGSGDLMHTAYGDGWIRLPQRQGPLGPGTAVPFLPLSLSERIERLPLK